MIMRFKTPLLITIFSAFICALSCGKQDPDANINPQDFNIVSSNVIETDSSGKWEEYNENPHISFVWFVESRSSQDILIKKPCEGLTQLDNQAHKSCRIPEGMSEQQVDFAKFKHDIASYAKKQGISEDNVDSFIDAIKESEFIHKLRKVNTFGQENSLYKVYPEYYGKLVSFLFNY